MVTYKVGIYHKDAEKTAIYKLVRSQKKATLPTPSSLQNCEEVDVFCLSHLAYGISSGNPSKLIELLRLLAALP